MEFSKRVKASFAKQKFMQVLGAKLVKIEKGFCEIHVPYNVQLTQQHEYFHAGVIGTIADTAGGYAAYSLMNVDTHVLTVEFKVNLLAPARGNKLIARSKVIKAGKTLTICNSDIFTRTGKKEKLCATATITLIALHNYKK
jgi:uncharacterized protein (TIGR00369 family)